METSAEAALLFMWVSHGLIHLRTRPHTHTAVCPLPYQQDGEKIRKVIENSWLRQRQFSN